MLPGVYDSISNEEYHAGEGESKSLLDLVRRSPVHYRARTMKAANDDAPREPTPAQRIGTAFHALLLEPQEFAKTYCLALRPQDLQLDHPLVESRDQLVAMIEELNEGRQAKLATGGTKDELVTRIVEADPSAPENVAQLQAMKLAELKTVIATINESRPGKLSTTGTMGELAQLLRDSGRQVTLWADVKAQWLANNAGSIVLTQDEWDMLHSMREAVMAHPAARKLMTGAPGVAERSVYWRDPVTGLVCRCRPDFWRQDGILVDVKTTDDASEEAFARSISTYRYYVQHPFYVDGISLAQTQSRATLPDYAKAPIKAFVFLAVEKGARVVDGQALGVGVYVLDDESVALGRAEYEQDLKAIAACKVSGVFPGYGDKVQGISLPRWKLAQAA